MTVSLTSLANGTKRAKNPIVYPKQFITEFIPTGFFTVDDKWTVGYWNKAAEKIIGIAIADIVGKNLWKDLPPAFPLEFTALYRNKTIAGGPGHFEEYLGQIGSWHDVVVYHSGGTLSVSFKSKSHFFDSQDPDYPAQQLKVLNELYRFVSELTNDCLWEWNLQNKLLFWIDGGHKRAFGYDIKDAFIPQRFWEDLLHPEDKERVLTHLSKMISVGNDDTWEIEYRFKRENGDYAYVHDRARILYDGNNVISRMIGTTQDITERKLAETQLSEKQKEITEAVLTAHDNERKMIGRELHDNLNQILGAAKLYIEVAKTDEKNWKMCLEKATVYITGVIEEIRSVSKTLVSPDTHFLGLIESIRNLVDDTMLTQPIKFLFYQKGIIEDKLSEKLKIDIFRIIQEQVKNILTHSGASRAVIDLSTRRDKIILKISDDGKGHDNSSGMGVGLINIRNRAELNQGNITVVTKPGAGYLLKVVLNPAARTS